MPSRSLWQTNYDDPQAYEWRPTRRRTTTCWAGVTDLGPTDWEWRAGWRGGPHEAGNARSQAEARRQALRACGRLLRARR